MEESSKSKINVSDYFVEGPSQKLFRKLKLTGSTDTLILRKVIFFLILAWLPLLIFSLIDSTAYNSEIEIPLLFDFVLYVRVFLVIPLVFIAERIFNSTMYGSLNHFVESGIIAENNVDEYKSILKIFGKYKDSGIIDLLVFMLAYAIVILVLSNIWKSYGESGSLTSWQYSKDVQGQISLGGYWYAFITIPIYIFFFARLLWKFLLWSFVLYKISKINLNLFPTDPDRSGGLGFLGQNQLYFGLLGFIQTSIFSAEIASKILYAGTVITDYKSFIIGILALFTLIIICPMMFFTNKLIKTKLNGILEYSVTSHMYVSAFHDKWIDGKNSENENLLGSADIQSLADLSGSYDIVKTMIPLPIDLRAVITLVLLVTVPFSPLILFVIPLDQLFKEMAGFIF